MTLYKRDFGSLRKDLLDMYNRYKENNDHTFIKSEGDANRQFKALYLAYEETQKNTNLD